MRFRARQSSRRLPHAEIQVNDLVRAGALGNVLKQDTNRRRRSGHRSRLVDDHKKVVKASMFMGLIRGCEGDRRGMKREIITSRHRLSGRLGTCATVVLQFQKHLHGVRPDAY